LQTHHNFQKILNLFLQKLLHLNNFSFSVNVRTRYPLINGSVFVTLGSALENRLKFPHNAMFVAVSGKVTLYLVVQAFVQDGGTNFYNFIIGQAVKCKATAIILVEFLFSYRCAKKKSNMIGMFLPEISWKISAENFEFRHFAAPSTFTSTILFRENQSKLGIRQSFCYSISRLPTVPHRTSLMYGKWQCCFKSFSKIANRVTSMGKRKIIFPYLYLCHLMMIPSAKFEHDRSLFCLYILILLL